MKRLIFVLMSFILIPSAYVEAEEDMRIVSLVPSGTEIVYELGLLDKLVGVTTVDSYPEELEDMDLVRLDVMMLDIETLLELEPTHIISHEMNASMTEEILNQVEESIDVEILVIEDEKTLEDIAYSIETVGVFLDVKDASTELAEEFLEGIDELEALIDESHDVMVFISLTPEIYTAGHDTFINSAIDSLGYTNVFRDLSGYKSINIEEILIRNPEYAINITPMDEDTFSEALSSLNLGGLNIEEENKQCTINPDLLSRPGIRIIEGLESIEACIND